MTLSHTKKRIFIFGSTGDLVKRKVIPALNTLSHFQLQIIALGRKPLSAESYWATISSTEPHLTSKEVANYRDYVMIDLENSTGYKELLGYVKKPDINYFYSALPPQQTEKVVTYLGKLKSLGYKVRLLTEKPFGASLLEAKKLKKIIEKETLTNEIFISDHYLFKKEIVNLRRQPFKKIKIVSLEEVGLEKRHSYYDGVGALKDMIQSHFLNIVFKLTTNPQKEFSKIKIIHYERGQYGDGKNNGYAIERGGPSETETFIHLIIQTPHKEFEFITGKKFDKKVGYFSIDHSVTHFDHLDNPYTQLFNDFFSAKKKSFATVESSILSWKIIETVGKKRPQLSFYKEKRESQQFTA